MFLLANGRAAFSRTMPPELSECPSPDGRRPQGSLDLRTHFLRESALKKMSMLGLAGSFKGITI
jgi:hypothetical protein